MIDTDPQQELRVLRPGTRVRLEDPSLPEHRRPTGVVIGSDYINKLAEVRWDARHNVAERVLPAGALTLSI